MISFTLPLPPSTNNLFATVRGRRVKSRAYKAWLLEAGRAIGRVTAFAPAPSEVTIKVMGKVNAQRDLDNFAKPILDLLVFKGFLQADSLNYVSSIFLVFQQGGYEPRLVVEVRHATDGPFLLEEMR